MLTHTCSFRSQPLSNSLSTPAVVCDSFVCDSSARRRGQKSCMLSLSLVSLSLVSLALVYMHMLQNFKHSTKRVCSVLFLAHTACTRENFVQKCAERCLGLPHPASTHVGKSEPDVSIARDKRGVGCTSALVAPTIEGRIDRAIALAPAKPQRQLVYCDLQGSRAFFATGVWGTAHQSTTAHTLHMYTAHAHAVCDSEDTLYTNHADSHGCNCTLGLW